MEESIAQTRSEIFAELRKNYGALRRLAAQHGCSVSWINRVFKGEHDDDDLIVKASELLVEIFEERQNKLATAKANMRKVKQLATA